MATLTDDLPCDGCRYNLRGLDATDGRCPECGRPVAAVIAAAAARGRRFVPDVAAAGPQCRRDWVEGLALILIGVALAAATGEAPDAMQRRFSAGRVVLLFVVVTGWVLHGYGLWKVAAIDPAVDGPDHRYRGRLALRIPAAVWTLAPAAVAVNVYDPNDGLELVVVPFLIAAVTAAAVLHARLRRLSGGAGAPTLAAQSLVLAILMPLAVVVSLLATPSGGYDQSTLRLMWDLPWPSCASPTTTAWLLEASVREQWLAALWAVVPLWELTVVVLVLWRLDPSQD